MADWYLEQYREAVTTLRQAKQMAEEELASNPSWNRELTIRLLLREAEQLINVPAD